MKLTLKKLFSVALPCLMAFGVSYAAQSAPTYMKSLNSLGGNKAASNFCNLFITTAATKCRENVEDPSFCTPQLIDSGLRAYVHEYGTADICEGDTRCTLVISRYINECPAL